MGVLDSILEYKRQKEAQANADIAAIPQGVNAFLQAREQARKSALDEMLYNMNAQKFQIEAQKAPYEIKKLEQDVADSQSKIEARNKIPSLLSNLSGTSGLGVTGASIDPATGDIKYTVGETPEAKDKRELLNKEKEEGIKGVGNEAAGKVALAKESLQNLDDVIATLFPDGTPKSFNREIATSANPPKILGMGFQTRPDNPLDKSDDAIVGKSQDVFRKIGASLSGRQLIQTGVAARPEETSKLIAQFAPNIGSNPEAAMKGLKELRGFYEQYLKEIDPKGLKGANSKSGITKTPGGISYKVIK